jgi:hypothetical protein
MENIKDVRNDAVIKAMESLKDGGKEAQDAMTDALVRAEFLVPVVDPFGGKHKIPDDELPPCTIKNPEGKLWVPVFTDWTELMRSKNAVLTHRVVRADISDCLGYLTGHDRLEGVTINPFGRSMTLPRGLVENLAKFWSRVKTAELNGETPPKAGGPQQIRLSVPKEYPDCVRPFLIAAMKKIPDVSRAWMCRVDTEGGKDYTWLVIVESEQGVKGREELFRAAAQNLLPCVDNRNIGFTAAADQFKGLMDNAEPIYSKGMDEEELKKL